MAVRVASEKAFLQLSRLCVYTPIWYRAVKAMPTRRCRSTTMGDKMFSESTYRDFREDFDVYMKIARYRNLYRQHCRYDGQPAAICRKVIAAKLCCSPKLRFAR
jgi:hypothetical protein